MKASAAQIRAALGKPDTDVRVFLLHGPDTAGAGELAALLGRAMGPDAERIDLDGAALRADSALLADEAASLSLFGTARYIRVTGAGEESTAAVEALLDADRAGNPAVVIAPTVRSTSKLVKLALAHPRALAFACYVPEGANAERMAAEVAAAHGLRPAAGVARRLLEAAAGDRAVVTREVEKLALFLDAAPDRPQELDHAALDAVGADLAESELSGIVEAVLRGDAARVGEELTVLDHAGGSPIPWLRSAARRLVQLAELRAQIDAGERADQLLQRVPFPLRDATGAALRRWTGPMLITALERVRAAERAVTAPGNAGPVLAAETIASLTRKVQRRG